MSVLNSSLATKNGFHTTYSTKIAVTETKELADCNLYLLYILPSRIFIDPYELYNFDKFYSFKHWGTSNLELPGVAVDAEDSALLLNITLPNSFGYGVQSISVDVPLHMRYGRTVLSEASGETNIVVPWPTGFWACLSSGMFDLICEYISFTTSIRTATAT